MAPLAAEAEFTATLEPGPGKLCGSCPDVGELVAGRAMSVP